MDTQEQVIHAAPISRKLMQSIFGVLDFTPTQDTGVIVVEAVRPNGNTFTANVVGYDIHGRCPVGSKILLKNIKDKEKACGEVVEHLNSVLDVKKGRNYVVK